MFEPKDIKVVRQKMNLTQLQLANISGVSQSMIAKLEAGTLDPTYSHFKKIIDALEQISGQKCKSAKDIMNKNIVIVHPQAELPVITNLMKKKNFSQIPVMENNRILGMVTERSILDADFSKLNELVAEDVMLEAPPIISEETTLDLIGSLLKEFQLLFVTRQGEYVGVITKADYLKEIL